MAVGAGLKSLGSSLSPAGLAQTVAAFQSIENAPIRQELLEGQLEGLRASQEQTVYNRQVLRPIQESILRNNEKLTQFNVDTKTRDEELRKTREADAMARVQSDTEITKYAQDHQLNLEDPNVLSSLNVMKAKKDTSVQSFAAISEQYTKMGKEMPSGEKGLFDAYMKAQNYDQASAIIGLLADQLRGDVQQKMELGAAQTQSATVAATVADRKAKSDQIEAMIFRNINDPTKVLELFQANIDNPDFSPSQNLLKMVSNSRGSGQALAAMSHNAYTSANNGDYGDAITKFTRIAEAHTLSGDQDGATKAFKEIEALKTRWAEEKKVDFEMQAVSEVAKNLIKDDSDLTIDSLPQIVETLSSREDIKLIQTRLGLDAGEFALRLTDIAQKAAIQKRSSDKVKAENRELFGDKASGALKQSKIYAPSNHESNVLKGLNILPNDMVLRTMPDGSTKKMYIGPDHKSVQYVDRDPKTGDVRLLSRKLNPDTRDFIEGDVPTEMPLFSEDRKGLLDGVVSQFNGGNDLGLKATETANNAMGYATSLFENGKVTSVGRKLNLTDIDYSKLSIPLAALRLEQNKKTAQRPRGRKDMSDLDRYNLNRRVIEKSAKLFLHIQSILEERQ